MKAVLRVYSMEVPAREKDDLKEEPIVVKLRKVRPARSAILRALITWITGGLFRLEVQATTAFSHTSSPAAFVALHHLVLAVSNPCITILLGSCSSA